MVILPVRTTLHHYIMHHHLEKQQLNDHHNKNYDDEVLDPARLLIVVHLGYHLISQQLLGHPDVASSGNIFYALLLQVVLVAELCFNQSFEAFIVVV